MKSLSPSQGTSSTSHDHRCYKGHYIKSLSWNLGYILLPEVNVLQVDNVVLQVVSSIAIRQNCTFLAVVLLWKILFRLVNKSYYIKYC